MKPKYICAISAIIAVVLFLALTSFMYSGEASYTRNPETWYWSLTENSSALIVSPDGTFMRRPLYSAMLEGSELETSSGGSVLMPIFVVNPNPTLYIRVYTSTNAGFLHISSDGRTGAKVTANVSMYSSPAVYNAVLVVPTNFTQGYSVLNLTVVSNGSQNSASISSMWLQ